MSLSELALDQPDSPTKLVDGILRASRRGRDLVQRILVFSRGQAIDLGPIALGPVVSDAVDAVRGTLPPHIGVDTNIAAPALTVRSEGSAIRRMISDLVSNAVEAMTGEGRIEVEVSRVEIDAHAAGKRLGLQEGVYGSLVVRDRGVGMDAAMVGRCFEPFFTTKGCKRAGLGLATVYGLVQEHRGSVWIDSTPGRGTSVTIHIPSVER